MGGFSAGFLVLAVRSIGVQDTVYRHREDWLRIAPHPGDKGAKVTTLAIDQQVAKGSEILHASPVPIVEGPRLGRGIRPDDIHRRVAPLEGDGALADIVGLDTPEPFSVAREERQNAHVAPATGDQYLLSVEIVANAPDGSPLCVTDPVRHTDAIRQPIDDAQSRASSQEKGNGINRLVARQVPDGGRVIVLSAPDPGHLIGQVVRPKNTPLAIE